MFTGLRPYRICGGDTITNGYTYKKAGVDIDAGNRLVERIKPLAAATRRSGAAGDLGGFGGLFDPRAAGYDDPVLVAATDGVGTKLKLAIDADKHDTVGIDLVAMCANDLIVQGAEPLFFLDYFATGKLAEETAAAVIAGVAEGCREAGCALIGGETAEMPGMYADGDYDLAGFCVGAAERGSLIDGGTIAPDDIVLGLASSGVHSNGYSLVRKLVSDGGFRLDDPAPFDAGQPLGSALLTPTRLYIRSCLAAIRSGGVKGLAHITGGGILENLPRIFPGGVGVEIDCAAWPAPPVFRWLAGIGGIEPVEMARTFNCGIGMAVVVAPDEVERIETGLRADGETVYRIGRIVPGDGEVLLQGMDRAWAG